MSSPPPTPPQTKAPEQPHKAFSHPKLVTSTTSSSASCFRSVSHNSNLVNSATSASNFVRVSPNILSPRVTRLRKSSLDDFLNDDASYERLYQSTQFFERGLNIGSTSSTSNNANSTAAAPEQTNLRNLQTNLDNITSVTSAPSNQLPLTINLSAASGLPKPTTEESGLSGLSGFSDLSGRNSLNSSSRCDSPTIISMPPSPLAVGKASRDFSTRMSPHTVNLDAQQHLRNLSSNSNSYDSYNSPFASLGNPVGLLDGAEVQQLRPGSLILPRVNCTSANQTTSQTPSQETLVSHSPSLMSPSSLLINRASHNSSPGTIPNLSAGPDDYEVTQTHIHTIRQMNPLSGQYNELGRAKNSTVTPGYTSPITPQKKYITKGIRRSPAPPINFRSSILSIHEPGSLKRKAPISNAHILPERAGASPQLSMMPQHAQAPPRKKKNFEPENTCMDTGSTSDEHLSLPEPQKRLQDWVQNVQVTVPPNDNTYPRPNDKIITRSISKNQSSVNIGNSPIIPQLQPLQVHGLENKINSSGFSSPFSPFSNRSKSPTPSEGSVGSSDMEVLRILQKSGNKSGTIGRPFARGSSGSGKDCGLLKK